MANTKYCPYWVNCQLRLVLKLGKEGCSNENPTLSYTRCRLFKAGGGSKKQLIKAQKKYRAQMRSLMRLN